MQKYGHVSAVCRGNVQCARCRVIMNTGNVVRELRPNAVTEHSDGFGGCTVHKQAAEVKKNRNK